MCLQVSETRTRITRFVVATGSCLDDPSLAGLLHRYDWCVMLEGFGTRYRRRRQVFIERKRSPCSRQVNIRRRTTCSPTSQAHFQAVSQRTLTPASTIYLRREYEIHLRHVQVRSDVPRRRRYLGWWLGAEDVHLVSDTDGEAAHATGRRFCAPVVRRERPLIIIFTRAVRAAHGDAGGCV